MSTTYMEYDPKRGIYVRKDHRDERKPLNCPKGYGLCWTCSTWCDLPGCVQTPQQRGTETK